MADGKIESFEELTVWQESQNLAVMVYQETRLFPKEEVFGITSQIRRSVSSISANIAEGFGRKSSKDKLHFYVIAYGSLLETRNFISLSSKLDYLNEVSTQLLLEKCTSCQKLLNAFMRPLR